MSGQTKPHLLCAQPQETVLYAQKRQAEVYSAHRQTKQRSYSMSGPSKPPRRRAIVLTRPRGLLSSTQLTTRWRTTATTWCL